jgi:hypothetical protein
MEPNKARGVGIVGRRMPPHLPRLAECIPANAFGHGERQREPVMAWKVFPDHAVLTPMNATPPAMA